MKDHPYVQCPNCGRWVEDLDGFGVLVHDECGYCSHPDVYGGGDVMTRTCVVEGCDRTDIRSRGMCRRHYRRYERHGDPLIVWPSNHPAYTITCAVKECMREPTEDDSGMCHHHHWTTHVWPLQPVFADPYPGWEARAACVGFDTEGWYLDVGETAPLDVGETAPPVHVIELCAGLTLDHMCMVRLCVNPDHLDPVVLGVNIRRGSSPAVLTARSGTCRRGHKMEGANLYVVPKTGARRCLACVDIRLGRRSA